MLHKTLAGSPDGGQHLAEYLVGSDVRLALPPQDIGAPPRNQVLVAPVPGAVIEVGLLGQMWRVAPGQVLWLRHSVPVHLRSCGPGPATALVWRFTVSSLPLELARLTDGAARLHPVYVGPRVLTPTESALVLGLRSCPVASSLRGFWAAAKLVEWLTHLWPADATVAGESVPADAGAGLPPAVRRAVDFMHGHLAHSIGLGEIAAAAGQSPAHFSRVFSESVGRGPTAHLRWLRMERAGALIRTGQANVTEAAFAVGYQSLGQFSRVFSEHHGRPPSAFLPRR